MRQADPKRFKSSKAGKIIIFLVGIVCPLLSNGQRYPFHNLGVDDGLMQSQATSLTQDKEGNLWIGTLGGLSRYDGRNFTNFSVQDGLPDNAVRSVAADSQGNIWVGCQGGLSKFNGKKFIYFPKPRQLTHTITSNQQIQIVNDTIWWKVQGDICFLSGGKLEKLKAPADSIPVSAFLAEKSGMWIAKDSFVFHKQNAGWDTLRFAYEDGLKPMFVFRILKDKNGSVWMATNNGLYQAGNRLISRWILPETISNTENHLPIPFMTCICQDRLGALWIGTNNGAERINFTSSQLYNKHNGLCDNTILDILTDSEGNIWLASDGQGIFRYSGTQFTGLDETSGLPSAQIMAIASNKKDSLFLGSYDAGLYVFTNGKISPLEFPLKPVPAITSLCYSSGSRLWIGTRGQGLWTYKNGIWRQFASPDRNFPSNFINCLYEDTARRLWIGFVNGAMVFEDDKFKDIDNHSAPVVSFLTIGHDSTLMTGDNGMKLYTNGIITPFRTNTGADSANVQCFILKGRDLWMGSSDKGVFRYNMDTHKSQVINKSRGLRSDFIYNIIDDKEDNIWVGTGFGIHRIRTTGPDAPGITFYGKAQGVTGMESNINSVIKLPDGSIWFGTTNGAFHYQADQGVVNSGPTSIQLQSVRLAGETLIERNYYDSLDNWHDIPYHLRLPYKKNNISFTFQAISLGGGQNTQYRYRLLGLDASAWSEWGPGNSVTYSALPPGKFAFQVECRAGEGKANPRLEYPFEIITPLRKTTLFRFAVLIACILTGIVLQYIVGSRKQRRQRLLDKLRAEEQSKIRLRTAEDFHDEIGNKLTRINVLTNVLKNKISLTPESERILNQIEDNTGQLYTGTRDILWSLKPSNDNLYEILHHIRDFGADLFMDTEVNFEFKGASEKWRNFRLPMDMSRNLVMIFKEALNNCLKYSQAHNVSLEVILKNRNVLQMILKDDGKGFDKDSPRTGNGINNMHVRATRLGGRLYVDSRKNKGTIINLTFKLPRPTGK